MSQKIKFITWNFKTNTLGYDGHGQFVLNSLDDIKKDWCFTADYILEKKVEFKKRNFSYSYKISKWCHFHL
jgi:phosphoribosylaminoimidazole carboxylase (NCAIR synthetase)